MFGCYRRSDAADAETYVAAVTMVLAHYPAEVVKAVTDPYSGLPSRKNEKGWSGLPDVADVKEACEEEAIRQERFARIAVVRPVYQRLAAPPAAHGACANVYVPPDHPKYPQLVERAAHDDPRCWRRDETRDGIWVSLEWLGAVPARAKLTPLPLTDADLRRMYPPRDPAPAHVSHETRQEPT